MKLTDLMTLVQAGFTKADIMALASADAPAAPAAPAATPAPAPAAPAAPAPATPAAPAAPAPAQDPAPAAPMSEQEKLIRALGLKIDSLQQSIHMANVQGDSTNNPGGQDVDSILARIINPEEGGK